MLHSPELLFLDEPTIGLDVVAKQRVRDFLIEINRDDGVTVLLTTHDLGDIERLCERLLVIDSGSLIWDGPIAELRERYGDERTLIVDLEEPAPPLEIAGARVERVDGPRQWLRFRGSAAELTARVAASAQLVDLQITEPDIEEIVRSIYSSSRGPAGAASP
jgi:ABC-2 type transport system ATP-binding protein